MKLATNLGPRPAAHKWRNVAKHPPPGPFHAVSGTRRSGPGGYRSLPPLPSNFLLPPPCSAGAF